MRIPILLSLLALLVLPTLDAAAQEVEASVNLNVDQLSLAGQTEVSSFAEELRRYVESNRWTDDEWEGERVKMTFSVVFTGGSDDGIYSARLLIGSQRAINNSTALSPMMKILDDHWTFRYARNQPFVQDATRYDELTGLIDFYVYTAIGLDLDSYAPKGGSSLFAKAWSVAQRAQIRTDLNGWGTDGVPGSYTRYNLIRELTDLRFDPIRNFTYNYHYNGLDNLASNRTRALDSIRGYLGELALVKDRLVQGSTIIRVLNDTKNVEYAELFRDYIDPEGLIWRTLNYLDPSHKSVYDAARDRR